MTIQKLLDKKDAELEYVMDLIRRERRKEKAGSKNIGYLDQTRILVAPVRGYARISCCQVHII